MKKFGLFLMSALALVALASCNDDLEVSPNESYFASEATITSSDSNVTITGNEAEVTFKVEGGTVTFTVDCGCEWTAKSYKPEYFTASTTSTSVTITAVQNTIENQLAGVVSLMTAGESIQFARIQVYQNAYGAPEISVSANEWNAPAVGALTTEIAVEASADWTAEATDSWLTVTKTDSGITLTAEENEETTERETKVTLTCTDGIRTAYDYIAVTQDGKAYITLSDESLTLFGNASSTTIAVETNFDDWSCESDEWITITRNGDAMTVSVEDNDGESRNGTVTVTAGDGADNVAEAQLTITQSSIADLILTYTITSANTTTQLPLYGNVDCTVDWGDGSETETVTTQFPSHTYVAAGEYDIFVNGTVSHICSTSISTGSNPLPLTAVKQWGQIGLTSLDYAFGYCENLKSLPEYTGNALDNVTDLYYAFGDCTALEEIPKGLLDGCSKAKDLSWIFVDCQSIKTLPQGLFDNCTSATTFRCAFQNCYALETIPDGLFDNCTAVTTFYWTFINCRSLKTIPAGLFANCPSVTTFYQCFYGCSSLKTISADMFSNCTKVTTFYCTFDACSSLEEIPAGLFDDCPAVTNFSYTFWGCSSLKSIPEGLFKNCPKVTNFSYAFCNDEGLTGESPYDLIDGVKVHLYERADHTDIYSKPSTTSGCFTGCTGLSDYDDIPDGWK